MVALVKIILEQDKYPLNKMRKLDKLYQFEAFKMIWKLFVVFMHLSFKIPVVYKTCMLLSPFH